MKIPQPPIKIRKAKATEIKENHLPPTAGNMVFVASTSQGVVGFIYADRNPGKVGSINSLFVQEGFRRSQVGSSLLKAAKTYLKNNGANQVVVVPSQESRKFYEKRLNHPFLPIPSGLDLYGNLKRKPSLSPLNALNKDGMLKRRLRTR